MRIEVTRGEVTVTVDYTGPSHRGHGNSTDIVEAGVPACLDLMNRICRLSVSQSALTAAAASTAGDTVVCL